MFANRISELKALEEEYLNESTSFSVIYGRRFGKTALISEFIKKSSYIFVYNIE